MPAVTMTNTEMLTNDFLYLVPVTISLSDRLEDPAEHFKTCWSMYAKAVIQVIAPQWWMYNLLTELRTRVIDSLVKVTPCIVLFLCVCESEREAHAKEMMESKRRKRGSHGTSFPEEIIFYKERQT